MTLLANSKQRELFTAWLLVPRIADKVEQKSNNLGNMRPMSSDGITKQMIYVDIQKLKIKIILHKGLSSVNA